MPQERVSRFASRISIALAALVGVAAVGLGGYNLASADVSSGDRPVFIPINPCRLVDTRAAVAVGPRATPLGAAETITLTAHGENGLCTGASAIPTDAIGVSMNVTALQATERTFLTFWGEGPNPGTSNLNPNPGSPPTPNAVGTPLSPTGTFNVFNSVGSVEVIIDVNGYYANHNHDDRYVTQEDVDAALAAQAALNDTFVTSDELGETDFLASGTVSDADDLATATVASFSAPTGVTAAVVEELDVGQYVVTLSGLSGPIDGTILTSPIGDPTPLAGSEARGCSVGNVLTSNATTFEFEIGCFGESDVVGQEGSIIAEDSSFHFAVLG